MEIYRQKNTENLWMEPKNDDAMIIVRLGPPQIPNQAGKGEG